MNRFHNFNKKTFTAFTLAEVLITLGIIGVVATLVIPPLVKNYQKMTYVTGLKKGYSEFQQGIKLYMADQGTTDLSQTDLFNKDGSTNFYSSTTRQAAWDSVMRKYFKVIKACNIGDASCAVYGTYLNYAAQDPYYKFGDDTTSNNFYYNFFTADGIGFQILPQLQNDCKRNIRIMKGYCADVFIDANGAQPPNKTGRDFFWFILNPDGNLYPVDGMVYAQYWNGDSWNTAANYWQSNSVKPASCGNPDNTVIPDNTYGSGCAARIMENGWVMDY